MEQNDTLESLPMPSTNGHSTNANSPKQQQQHLLSSQSHSAHSSLQQNPNLFIFRLVFSLKHLAKRARKRLLLRRVHSAEAYFRSGPGSIGSGAQMPLLASLKNGRIVGGGAGYGFSKSFGAQSSRSTACSSPDSGSGRYPALDERQGSEPNVGSALKHSPFYGSSGNFLELFTAVEQDDIGRVRSMLERGDVDIHGENSDDLTLLDVATMLCHQDVALLLLKHGAQENPRLASPAARMKHLNSLIDAAQSKVAEFSAALTARVNPASKELDGQLSAWESRLHMLKKMKTNFENSSLPESPPAVLLNVTSQNSLQVQFERPSQAKSIVTRYKVEWSLGPDFSQTDGSLLIKDLRRLEVSLPNLRSGETYFVRVSAGNFKGYSEPRLSQPESATPSSWREVDGKCCRHKGRLNAVNTLFYEVKEYQQSDQWEKKLNNADSPHKRKRPSLRNLFLANSKFMKNAKKGIYLASILYKDDKILCTVDDCVPLVVVDDNVPSEPQLSSDLNWFIKVSCAWEDVKSLSIDGDSLQASPTIQFRMKLVEAAINMQASLGIQDLGRLHHLPIVDANGVTLLLTVQYVPDPKSVQGLAVKWVQMNKFLRKQLANSSDGSDMGAMDLLVTNLLDYLNFYESASVPLDRGLYLGYVKLQSTMSQISILVPENLPSVLPFVYIRDNPHVSKEEWEWLRSLNASQDFDSEKPSSAQRAFHQSLTTAARTLLDDLDVSEDEIATHRIYRVEVVEIHHEVSFILLVPCHGEVCSAPGQTIPSGEEKRCCLSLPMHIFEFTNLCTYQPEFVSLYCRLSALLEMYLLAAEQLKRQAFSDTELTSRSEFVDRLKHFQSRLDEIWRPMRWAQEISFAIRDRRSKCGLPLSILFSFAVPPELPTSPIPIEEDTRPSTSDPNMGAPGEDQPRGARKRPQSQASDENVDVEDNSDVGYHSDQSIDKMGIGAGVPPAIPPKSSDPTSSSMDSFPPKIPPRLSLDNQAYGHLWDSVSGTTDALLEGQQTVIHKTPANRQLVNKQLLPRSYVNLPPPAPLPISRSDPLQASSQFFEVGALQTDSTPPIRCGAGRVAESGSTGSAGRTAGTSFLCPPQHARRYRLHGIEGKYKTHIPVGGQHATTMTSAGGDMQVCLASRPLTAPSHLERPRCGSAASISSSATNVSVFTLPAETFAKSSYISPLSARSRATFHESHLAANEYANLSTSNSDASSSSEAESCREATRFHQQRSLDLPSYSSRYPSVPQANPEYPQWLPNVPRRCSENSHINHSHHQQVSSAYAEHEELCNFNRHFGQGFENQTLNWTPPRARVHPGAFDSAPATPGCGSPVAKIPPPPKYRQAIHASSSALSGQQYPANPASRCSSVVSFNAGVSSQPEARTSPAHQTAILRVYAAYDTGLAKGTSVKLQVSARTTSREVVVLVVQQLNKAAKLKGLSGPFYGDDELDSFCLAAVIGSRERCLRDDYRPLELQNPWCKGRLFVRKRSDVLAALEFGNSAAV